MRNKVDLVQQAVSEIEGWIKNHTYEDGDLLPSEGCISEQFEVSRATIRDAIRILEVRGFVERIHGVGVKVNNRSIDVAVSFLTDMMDRNDITFKEILELRRGIETESASLAALNRSDQDLDELLKCIVRMEKEDSTSLEHIKSDYRFHEGIARASGNRLLLAIIRSYRPLLQKTIHEADNNAIGLENRHHYHRNIYECIKKRQPDDAMKMILLHLEDTERNILGMVKKDSKVTLI